MPKYEVRLESQTDSQARLISLNADSETAARDTCEQSELDIVNFSLLPPERDVWECPPGTDPDSPDALVDLSRWDAYDPLFTRELPDSYSGHKRAANARLKDWAGRIDLSDKGKVRAANLGPRSTARFLAHHQSEPYEVVEVREVAEAEIEAQRLVSLAQALQGNPEEWQRTLDALREAGIPMAAVTAFLYGVPWQKQIDGSSVTVFSSATVKMSLHTGLTAVQDTDDFFNDVSATEITGTGYTAGGYTFAAKTTAYDTATDQIRLDNTTDPNWTTSTLSATDAIVTNTSPGTTATNPVYGNVDFGATVTTTAGTLTVALDPTGWAVFDVT